MCVRARSSTTPGVSVVLVHSVPVGPLPRSPVLGATTAMDTNWLSQQVGHVHVVVIRKYINCLLYKKHSDHICMQFRLYF